MRITPTSALPPNQSAVVINYPQPPQPKQPKPHKVYRVILNSNDRLSGTINNGIFRVRLPRSPKQNKCMMFIEFFAFESDVNGTQNTLDRYTYHVHINELNQPDTYYSKTGNTTNIVLTNKGREYLGNITDDTLGIPLMNKQLFEEGTINVFFSSFLLGNDVLGSKDWTMVFVIKEYDE